jgi:glycosyltransferase involved in cell wall biosynthesis
MSFGLGPVALNLALEQGRLSCDSRIWCLDSSEDRRWASQTYGFPEEKIQLFQRSWPNMLGYSLAMEKAARGRAEEKVHIVHQHGVWAGLSRSSNIMRDRCGAPIVVTPHGSLQSWAVRKSLWKKKLALALYEGINLHNASCFHAVGESEVADIRNFGLMNPVAVIPNGISQQWLDSDGNAESFRERFEISHDRRILLFLSRITPKKGLPMLLQSIHSLKKDFADWVLVIAGADEFGHKAKLLSIIKNLGLQDRVIFTGPLFDDTKRDAFTAADLFVLPSYSEGAPIVILESLAAGIPVVATKASPWKDLVMFQCGWLTEINQNALTEALEDALGKDSKELHEMGKRGRELVSVNYTWKKSAQMTIDLYEWLLARQERPEFVFME